MKNKIILSADTKFIDIEAREILTRLDAKISIINKRTKNHTRYIQQLEKEMKKLQEN